MFHDKRQVILCLSKLSIKSDLLIQFCLQHMQLFSGWQPEFKELAKIFGQKSEMLRLQLVDQFITAKVSRSRLLALLLSLGNA